MAGVSLDVYRGELFCLLGGSGCGKTTLLRMLAGFETPDEGAIEIDGEDQAGLPPYRRATNMMFQSYALFPHMTVERNVGYGLRREGVGKAEVRERVAEMLRLVQLESHGERRPHQLSGGERQRVALARALVKRPKLLLLDEPLAALDRKLRNETQFEFIRIQESLGITFIVVTHDQEEAMTLATRIGVMRAGRIVQVGEPREVYEYPRSRFVADFIGSVNLFEGRVADAGEGAAGSGGDGGSGADGASGGSGASGDGERPSPSSPLLIRSEEAGCDIRAARDAAPEGEPAPGDTVWFAVRPEKMRLARERPAAAGASAAATAGAEANANANVAAGLVEEIAYMGNLSVYQVLLDTGKRVRVTTANLERTDAGHAIHWDERVYVHWGERAGVVLRS